MHCNSPPLALRKPIHFQLVFLLISPVSSPASTLGVILLQSHNDGSQFHVSRAPREHLQFLLLMLRNFIALTFNSSSCQMIEVQINNISLVFDMNGKDNRLNFLKSNVFFLY
uniref:Uncharacterized protein n=1 Tax=Populus davidiana TaxID=266767 RepID=A0A6M2F2H7_9ROSI